MKLKFKNQQFQTDAVDSVADLFTGQEKLRSTFEITNIETIRSDEIVKAINNGKNKFDMIAYDECHASKSPSA